MYSFLPKPIIFGVSGTEVTDAEKEAYKKVNPLGFILFRKNIIDKDQCKSLCLELRNILGREDAPILIDQEGGSVNRLKAPIWRESESSLDLSKFAYAEMDDNIEKTAELVNLNGQLIGCELSELGINFNCAPVADLLIGGAHHITATRSFGPDPVITKLLVNNMIDGMRKTGVNSIIKHMLGQGRAKVDSHLSLPVVSEELSVLENSDFKVFKDLKNINFGMTAHIKYSCLDKNLPITYSSKAIDYIRNKIGFEGVLISDCLTMQALPESLGVKTSKSISSGIDVALYGGSDLNYLEQMLQNSSRLTLAQYTKITKGIESVSRTKITDYKDILDRYNNLYELLQSGFNSVPKSSYSKNLKMILQVLQERSRIEADYSSPLYKA